MQDHAASWPFPGLQNGGFHFLPLKLFFLRPELVNPRRLSSQDGCVGFYGSASASPQHHGNAVTELCCCHIGIGPLIVLPFVADMISDMFRLIVSFCAEGNLCELNGLLGEAPVQRL